MHFLSSYIKVRQHPKPFLERFFITDLKNCIKKFPTFKQMTEKFAFEVRPKNGKNHFFKMHFFHFKKLSDKIQNHFWKEFSSLISKMVLKSVLHKQVTQKIAFEVRLKNRKKRFPKKAFFDPFPSCENKKNVPHEI